MKSLGWVSVILLLFLVPKATLGKTIYVDGTYTGIISDGTQGRPYKTINSGIQNAESGDTVKVLPGVYEENVIIDENLVLSGTGPDTTVIKGAAGTAVTIQANYNVTLERFAVCNSNGHGIDIEKSTSTVDIIVRNIISITNSKDGFNPKRGCKAMKKITNCTFSKNAANGAVGYSTDSFFNCIVTNNSGYGFVGDYYDGGNPTVTFSNSWNNIKGNLWLEHYTPTDSKSVDPQYIDEDTGDLRLRSSPPSPCRNAGSTDAASRNPDGSRNDMGAYGGPGSAGFYSGYGSGPVVTELLVTPASVPLGATFTIRATGKAQ